MSKLFKCAKGCGSIEETDKSEVPTCCGVAMVEVSEDEVFGCGGCCHCCAGCASEGEEEAAGEETAEKK